MGGGAGRHDLALAAGLVTSRGGIAGLGLDGTEDGITSCTARSGGSGGLIGGDGDADRGLQTGLDLIAIGAIIKRRQDALEQSGQGLPVGPRRGPEGEGRALGQVGQEEEGRRVGRGALQN